MKDRLLLGVKIFLGIGLIISLGVTAHYEMNVKQNYQPGTEAFTQASDDIESYLIRNGCSSKKEIVEGTPYSRLEVDYITHEMSIKGSIADFDRGICLSFQATGW